MSMSTLNAQLASLASTTTTAGVVHASSRTNNDAIGRGYHHSSKHGHALSNLGDATKKASVLYDNAREAAEVTTPTLREHAVAALRTLCEESDVAGEVWRDPEFVGGDGLLSLHKLEHFERGTATSKDNAVVDKSIERLLGWLMTMTAECPPPTSTDHADVTSNPTLLACLHVTEYLLRKYDVHARPATARALLRTFLPLQLAHPTAYPSLFSRILALVDLQSLPEWTCLRPYAARGAPPLSRGVLAKQVARDDALVHVVAEIGRRGMEMCVREGTLAKEREMKLDGVDEEDGTKTLAARRGISSLISVSASVLVEAMHLQSANTQAVVSGGVKESTVRALFPWVLAACRSGGKDEVHCSEWKEWGRLVASTVATLCPLKHEVRTALADAIVAGLPEGNGMNKKKKQSFAEAAAGTDQTSLSADEADDATSGILALLSVLGARSAERDGGGDDDGDWEYYLPLLPPPQRRGRNQHVVDYLGCALPASTYKRLVKGEGLAAALGAALESLAGLHDEEDDDEGVNAMAVERLAPLVASIVMHAFRRLEAEAGKLLKDDNGKEKFRADRDVLLVLDLIQEPSLAPLWGANSSALVAAATVHTIASYSGLPTGAKERSSVIAERYASILRALAATDALVHDQGVAYAVHAALKSSDNGSGEATASRLGALLGREVASSSTSPKGATTTTERGAGAAAAGLLPARVALEHADAAVRRDAVARLESSIEEGDAVDDDLGRALLRRLAVEDDAAVASAAGDIVASQLKRLVEGDEDGMDVDGEGALSGFASLTDDFEGLAKEALASLHRWSSVALDDSWSPKMSPEKPKKKSRKKSKGEEDKSPLLNCIKICGTVAKLIYEQVYDEDDDSDPILDQFCSLFLSLGAHANCGTLDEVSEAAVAELLQLFGDDGSCDNVTDLIATHSVSHKILRCFFGQDANRKASAPKALQSRFLWLALHSYSKLLASDSEELSPDTLQIALDLALYQMQFYSKESKKSDTFQWEVEFLRDICQRYLSSVADGRGGGVEKAIMILASTPSSVSFDEVIKPAITSALSSKSQGGHGLAVLVHACLQPPASKEGFSRILALVQGMFEGKSISSKVARECIIPALALLSHPGRDVRERVIELLEQFLSVKKDEMLAEICNKATDKSSPLRSSLMMDGANALPNLLGQIVKYSDSSSSVQKFLIESCKTCASDDTEAFFVGGCEASAVVLLAMEKSGENAFPLSKRWELAGKGLFKAFLSYEGNEIPSPSLCRLRDFVISMLKGVLVNEAQAGDDGLSIQISVGPSRAGRRRSYSIGASESFTTLSPYPEDMLQAILEALPPKSPLLLSKHVVQNVLVRQSWASGVFPKLNSKSRKAVAAALLDLRTEHNDELAGSALSGLPLKSPDFVQLLKDVDASQSEMKQSAVVFITDCVQGKLEVLGGIADVTKLSSKLFDQLQLLSLASKASNNEGDSGGRDYTRVSLLQTLLSIHSHYKSPLSERLGGSKHSPSRRKRSRSHSDVGTVAAHAELLVGLVGGNASVIHPLNSGRGRSLSLALLTCLCEESPSTVVSSLLPALMSLAGTSQGTDKKVDTNAPGDALAAIVPAYCTHAASANLTLFGLLESLVGKIVLSVSENDTLLNHLVDALKILPTKESSSEAIASLAACVMALQAFNLQEPTTASDTDSESSGVDNASQKRLELRILANTTSGVKISVSLSLLQYAEKIMGYICGLSGLSKEESSSSETKVDLSEVAALALRGSDTDEGIPSSDYANLSHAQQRSILYLSINLLQSVRDTLSTPAARRVVRKSKGDDADLCLRLWNELMQTHSNALRAHAKLAGGGAMSSMEKKFWAAAPIATSECLENLQNLLPVPHFLASVSSALSDEGVDIYIRKKSMKLLTDRVAEVNSDSPEASLFIDMVPDLVGQITADQPTTVDGEDSSALMRKAITMKQGALIAIESFARSLASDDGKLGASAAAVFLPALASVTKLLNEDLYDAEEASSDVTDAECQLLSSSSLCLSTLVRTLQARCLPQLPTIVKPLVSSLKTVNSLMGEQAFLTGELMQLSILKVLQAIAETLPQFLLPYLPLIFSNSALPSKALQQGSTNTAAAQLETALATKVQIRQLIPSLAKALSKNLQSDSGDGNWEEACSIINVMNIAVESSQRSDLSPVIGKIFNGLVLAYGYEGDDDSRPQLLKAANKCLLSLVMKLSESQLRPLYARLREWRGSIEDKSDEPVSSIRRCAFWSLSAELSKSLRSIFLPCLTSVLPDVIDELEIAVSALCQRNKKGEGSKRRRVDETDGSDADIDNVAPLQPLLMCLESALKADAHEGGDWTRGDDNQRYNMILNHLGKLLMAQVPGDMPLSSNLSEQASTSSYQQLVQGVGTLEHGNVVGCLTALAAAAGNEQLWKPLNFAVLEACGHKRSEVRKAGVSCLLSIIETIGEEYMVLLPECLPVLSELLEDEDEIAGMAKECVRQGEELLGESLEDSLR